MSDWTEYARELSARRIERRKFLRGMLGISGLAVLQGNSLAKALVPRATAAALPTTRDNFTTICVGMMENRSFDHFFGWLNPEIGHPAVTTFTNPRSLEDPTGCAGSSVLAVDNPDVVPTSHLDRHCQFPDPDHGWDGGRIELNGGNLNGFVERSEEVGMGYFNEDDIEFSSWLVREYSTFENYFCSVLGPTYPNRLYLHSANGGGVKNNAIPAPNSQNPLPTGYTWPTIWDRLTEANVDWAFYGSDLPTIALFFHEIYENPGKVRHIIDFFIDAALGLLPRVAFFDPSFLTIGNDDHPAHDIRLGQRFIQDTFLAVKHGPQWYDAKTGKGAVWVMTYDEWGGFFDHVAPPTTADLRASTDPCENWGQMGFRVPTIMASPYANKGFVGSGVYDHTSILKMIEWNFGLNPLNVRDAAANNIGEVLDFSQTPRIDLPSEPPFIPVHEAGLVCAQDPIREIVGDQTLEPLPDIPVPAPGLLAGILNQAEQSQAHPELRALADAGYFGRFDMRERAKQGVFRD